MFKNVMKRTLSLLMVVLMLAAFIPNIVWAADLSGLTVDGLSAAYENGTWSVPSGNSIKGNVKTSKGSCNNTTMTGTLTLTNNLSATANLSFNWATNPNYGTLKIGGSSVSGTSGTKTIELSSGASTTVVITSADSDNGISSGITVTLSNISLQVKAVNATVTFKPGEHGSFTLDGTPVTSSVTRTQSSTIPFVLQATPDEGYDFYGWYDVTSSKYLSTDNPASLNIENNITVQPKFIPQGSAMFLVGNSYYLDLNEANAAAAAASSWRIPERSIPAITRSPPVLRF